MWNDNRRVLSTFLFLPTRFFGKSVILEQICSLKTKNAVRLLAVLQQRTDKAAVIWWKLWAVDLGRQFLHCLVKCRSWRGISKVKKYNDTTPRSIEINTEKAVTSRKNVAMYRLSTFSYPKLSKNIVNEGRHVHRRFPVQSGYYIIIVLSKWTILSELSRESPTCII